MNMRKENLLGGLLGLGLGFLYVVGSPALAILFFVRKKYKLIFPALIPFLLFMLVLFVNSKKNSLAQQKGKRIEFAQEIEKTILSYTSSDKDMTRSDMDALMTGLLEEKMGKEFLELHKDEMNLYTGQLYDAYEKEYIRIKSAGANLSISAIKEVQPELDAIGNFYAQKAIDKAVWFAEGFCWFLIIASFLVFVPFSVYSFGKYMFSPIDEQNDNEWKPGSKGTYVNPNYKFQPPKSDR